MDPVTSERFQALYESAQLIHSSLQLDAALDRIMDSLIQITQAERGFIMLLEGGELKVKVARNIARETIEAPRFQVSLNLVRRVMQAGAPLLINDALNDPSLANAVSVASLRLRSIFAVPLLVHGDAEGEFRSLFEDSYARRDPAFGNARFVRNLFERTLERQATRVVGRLAQATDAELGALTAQDLLAAAARVQTTVRAG
jgi:GAF domain-containing protein